MALAREAADLFQALPRVLLLLQPLGLLCLGLFYLGLCRSCAQLWSVPKAKSPPPSLAMGRS
jgi:hypothetical protein